MSGPYLTLERLNKYFGTHHVIQDLSLQVQEGEIVALLGPSGSGKTTLLRLLAGFEQPELGRIELEGEDLTNLAPARRGFGMVFQNYALFPHLSVGENVGFGLAARDLSPDEVRQRVAEMLSLVDLRGFEDRRVSEISGGQQQRVALARALAPEPRVLMLDEPLSNLDPALRERTRRELRRTLRTTGITTLLVTHEQEEAFELGDRVAVLHGGRLEQVGTPQELYESPGSCFVATFVGQAGVLQGIHEASADGRARICLLGKGNEAGRVNWWTAANTEVDVGDPVDVVVRPESLAFVPAAATGTLAGRVVACRYTGPVTYYTVALELGGEVIVLARASAAALESQVHVMLRPSSPPPHIFPRERLEPL